MPKVRQAPYTAEAVLNYLYVSRKGICLYVEGDTSASSYNKLIENLCNYMAREIKWELTEY